MKVGVLTFHHAKQSYGACLQCLATIKVLNKMGFDTELINYENYYEQKNFKDANKSITWKIITRINWFVRMYIYKGHKNPYLDKNNLDKLYGKITPLYKNIEELEKLTYDILLIGSDQVWNPELTGGKVDRAFLLEFGKAKKRISYASSMGSHLLSNEEILDFKRALDRFSAISVREQHAKEEIEKISNKEVCVVLDPTLLITGNEWRGMFNIDSRKNDSPPYVLTYFVGGNIEEYWPSIEEYVCYLNLPIYNVQTHCHKSKHVDKALFGLELKELVSYIDSASLIITDSFHGTAFSVNLHKRFVSIANKSNPVRVQNLLHSLGLDYRLNMGMEWIEKEIDYQEVEELLIKQRKLSLDWLSSATEIE